MLIPKLERGTADEADSTDAGAAGLETDSLLLAETEAGRAIDDSKVRSGCDGLAEGSLDGNWEFSRLGF